MIQKEILEQPKVKLGFKMTQNKFDFVLKSKFETAPNPNPFQWPRKTHKKFPFPKTKKKNS